MSRSGHPIEDHVPRVPERTRGERAHQLCRWIAPRTHRASGVTTRETVKYFDAARAERLMRAYKEVRSAVRP
jgi:hypothetical protein